MATEEVRWYALKIFYSRLLHIKAELDGMGITTYVAMTTIEKFENGKLTYVDKPLVASLLFLRTTENFLRSFKTKHNSDLMFYQDFATKKPAPIDDTEMRSFIILTAADRGTRVQYLGESVPDFKRGEHVRVIDGIYKGAEGYIKKVRSDRKLIVEVKGVAVVAVSYIHPAFLEKI
ncbi:MAG: UpxY family transcription antiterminator [Bacteroidales bacterium]|nr:UpxY family transcription antiterminator [Bacteroidales bacterium]